MKQLRQSLFLSFLCWVIALTLPMLVCAAASVLPGAQSFEDEGSEEAPLPEPSDMPEASNTAAEVPIPAEEAAVAFSADEGTVFPVRFGDGSVRDVSMAEFLPGVIAGEMPASFSPDALRSQAVAARTYILSCAESRRGAHPEAAVCTDPGCCQAWLSEEELRGCWGSDYELYREKIADAVRVTDGTCLYWEGRPILACFHASSLERTEDSGDVWDTSLPYLCSVSSPETRDTVPDLVTVVEAGREDFRAAIESVAAPVLGDDPAAWLGPVFRDDAGRVEGMVVGGAWVEGDTLRSLFALRSTAFTLEWDGQVFRFTVAGYGHGVGMSQYGAEIMAEQGAAWQDILAHYYPGAELKNVTEA